MNSTGEAQRIRVNRNVWKASLTKEIVHLEDNLDQIYYTAGIKPHRLVRNDANDESSIVNDSKGISHLELPDYEAIIDEQVTEVSQAVENISSLISSVTEFELPIPALVLIKLANKIGAIRCSDLKKKVPGTLAKKYILKKKSLELVKSSLFLYEWVSIILSKKIIPLQPYINQNLISTLAWTRTSGLQEHNENQYCDIRLQLIKFIAKMLEHLSLNLNLDGKQLSVLIEEELISTVEQMLAAERIPTREVVDSKEKKVKVSINGNNLQDNKTTCSLDFQRNDLLCTSLMILDRLFITYADFLDAKVEYRLKNFVIQSCVKIYRNFEQNHIETNCRKQLLHLLETISNRPFATSTTELAWHIFELAEKYESDPDIKYLVRRSIKLGLAHRPIVVSHFDVLDCYANPCSIENPTESNEKESSLYKDAIENDVSLEEASTRVSTRNEVCTTDKVKVVASFEISNNHEGKSNAQSLEENSRDKSTSESVRADSMDIGQVVTYNKDCPREDEPDSIDDYKVDARTVQADKGDKTGESPKDEQVRERDKVDESSDDESAKPYLDLFVDSIAGGSAPTGSTGPNAGESQKSNASA